ncbi:sigma-54 dependent transcriptional regulator [Asticcacaulis sp. YBE204]|uniref:sigma-54-dependent transcriptional regulator n=1 Tax=Asticcacaulis sp. YBE204 TaxID=1282363 RepID=UPI0003C3B825|nr:sigma-54 dependent transcriptional regulator [Asticcacaulis sp. YBE204]ESQ80543.1 Fis family transcriptional regulator [Asticcacaulis sp. YBE204]
MAKTILICDDDPTQRRLIQAVLEREGFHVLHAENGPQAYDRLSTTSGIDAVILDLVMPGQSGIDTLKDIRAAGIRTPVVVLTASGGIDTVVKAMQAGAQDFFIKPASPERILVSVRNALQMGDMVAEVSRLKKHAANRTSFDDLVGTSPAMTMVRRLGERAAKSGIPVLILGESGVGKELIARAIQGSSDRAGKPFVAVNCGALPANLVESILFGHEKGSFTGASDKHLGKFQEAHGGTLFLDEVGELPLDMQVKLLRALQEGEIDPVGSKRPVKVDVRIISATNRNLSDQVRAGAFREDLFYRLNVFPVEAPSLRERREDIPALIEHFIRRFNIEEGKRVTGVAPDALQLLCAHDWPGNVRQLENTVYRAIVLSDTPHLQAFDFPAISGQSLPVATATPLFAAPVPPVIAEHQEAISQLEALDAGLTDQPVKILDGAGHLRKLEDIERDLIEHAISVYAGHMSEVARRLGIGRSTLYRKVRDCGLEGMVKEVG